MYCNTQHFLLLQYVSSYYIYSTNLFMCLLLVLTCPYSCDQMVLRLFRETGFSLHLMDNTPWWMCTVPGGFFCTSWVLMSPGMLLVYFLFVFFTSPMLPMTAGSIAGVIFHIYFYSSLLLISFLYHKNNHVPHFLCAFCSAKWYK